MEDIPRRKDQTIERVEKIYFMDAISPRPGPSRAKLNPEMNRTVKKSHSSLVRTGSKSQIHHYVLFVFFRKKRRSSSSGLS
jgi:hypothetical protein